MNKHPSVYSLLKAVYPDCTFDESNFKSNAPPRFWDSLENHRALMEKLSTKLGIKQVD